MRMIRLILAAVVCTLFLYGCKGSKTAAPHTTNSSPVPVSSKAAAPLPDAGFRAEITLAEPPAKLRVGQLQVINIKVKNTSSVVWWQRGGETNDRNDNKFYIAAGSRWLDKDGKPTSEPEGHNGIPKDLKPGEEVEMSLQITAPKSPGEWTLVLDMVQEGVAWFGEKGSPTTKANVTVVK